jgi:hypothetical protein
MAVPSYCIGRQVRIWLSPSFQDWNKGHMQSVNLINGLVECPSGVFHPTKSGVE